MTRFEIQICIRMYPKCILNVGYIPVGKIQML